MTTVVFGSKHKFSFADSLASGFLIELRQRVPHSPSRHWRFSCLLNEHYRTTTVYYIILHNPSHVRICKPFSPE